ncbi:DnrP protein [Colwellia sp. RSH04]|nr:DnrP protein [Colwellia sp. RSH04]
MDNRVLLSMKTCLYCQNENLAESKQCSRCGMELPTKQPQSKKAKLLFFTKAFWFIVIFCIIMVIYLPR